jgi:hypothetical protein
MTRVLRAPALHFLCLGAALYILAPHDPSGDVSVRDEELLYRAAVELGVAERDPAVRDRLAKLGGFVAEEDGAHAVAREATARRLGLAESDLVVRRHLTMLMRLAVERLSPEDVPRNADLTAYRAAHDTQLRIPPRVRFTHVYLSRDRHRATLEATAAARLRTLRRDHVSPDRAVALGDAFPTGPDVGPLVHADVDRRFGAGFASRLASAEPSSWVGPIPSSYGLHLVWIHERLPAVTPPLDAIRGTVVHRWLRERREARARDRIAALRSQ